MKRYLQAVLLTIVTMFSMGLTCHAQNGPTPMQAAGTFTQAASTSTSGPVTGNEVYRCSPTPCTPAPPAILSFATPVTAFTDKTIVAGTSYAYAVTALFGGVEGPYSNVSAPYSWAYNAPVFGTVTGNLIPQAMAESAPVVAKVTHTPARVLPECRKCSTVSNLVIKRVP